MDTQLALHFVNHDRDALGDVLNWLAQVPPGSAVAVFDHKAFDDTVILAGPGLPPDAVAARLRQWAESWMDQDDQAHYGTPTVYITGFRHRTVNDGTPLAEAPPPHIEGGFPC